MEKKMETITLMNNFVLVNRGKNVYSLRTINPTSQSVFLRNTHIYERGKGTQML